MKTLGLGSLALAAMIAGPAIAADIPVKAAPPPPAVLYNWSGVYLGGSIGGAWTEVDRHYPNLGLFGIQQDYTSKGSDTILGFHAGAQAQWGNVVLGIEATLNSGIRPLESRVALPNTIFGPSFDAFNRIGNLFTVGPRLGYAWDRWMIYGTGGYASATITGDTSTTTPVSRYSSPAPTFGARPGTAAGSPAAASNTWCTRARSPTLFSASSTSTSTCTRSALSPTPSSSTRRSLSITVLLATSFAPA